MTTTVKTIYQLMLEGNAFGVQYQLKDENGVVRLAVGDLNGEPRPWPEAVKPVAARTAPDLIARREAADLAYRICAETRHVTLGDKVRDAIMALKASDADTVRVPPRLPRDQLLYGSPDYIDDPEGLARWREEARRGGGHDPAPINRNSLRRLLDTIARLQSAHPKPEPVETQPEASRSPERPTLGAYIGATSASNRKYPDAAEVSGGSFTFLNINESINFDELAPSSPQTVSDDRAIDLLDEVERALKTKGIWGRHFALGAIRAALTPSPQPQAPSEKTPIGPDTAPTAGPDERQSEK